MRHPGGRGMTPPGTEISGHGQLLVGPTGSGWEPLVGRELARAMLVGAGEDSRVFMLQLEPGMDVRLVVVFVRIGSLVCVVRPTGAEGVLKVELPFALGRRSAVAVVIECESEDQAAELVRRYDAERAAEGGEGAAPPPTVPPVTRSAPPPPPVSAPPPAAAPSAPPPAPAPSLPPVESAPPEEMPVEAAPPEEMPVEAAPPAAEPEPSEPADRRTFAHVHAEMPRRVAVETPVDVRFRLSRRRLEATPGTSSTAQSIRVDPARELTVTIALRGFRLVDESQATVVTRLPASPEDVAEHVFTIMAPLTGRGEVSLVVRQDADLPLATLRLTAEIVAADVALEIEPGGAAAEVVEPDPELVALPSIRIDESIVGTDSTLRIRVAVGGESRECTTHLADKAAFISRTYERIAGIRSELAEITDTVDRAEHGRRRLRALGMGLARALFDAEVRELLWNAAPDGLDGLIVQTAGEIDIPWEVVHLVPPTGVDEDDELRFLSSYGLTRWVYDTAHPTEFRVESRRVRYVCPDYAEHSLHLTHTAEERRMLEDRFAATTIDPDDAGGIAALMHEGFDLLHFAGHGRWNDQSPQAQELLLAGFRAQEEVPLARYSDEELRHDLPDVGSADATAAGPFVFLNACDIGRLPSGPASLGGFPEAFLRGGAAAFVGCSWAVGDDPASTFVDVFYRALADDDATIADATRTARLAAHEEADLSELAYAVYAHPRARMRVERPASSPNHTAPEGPPS
jgi:hypothetical protein